MFSQSLSRLFGRETNARRQERLLALAQQQLDAGAPAEAAESFRQVLAISPGHIDALCALGAIVSGQGRSDEALDIAQRLAQLEPDNPDHPTRAAMFLGQLGRADEARATLMRVLERHEDNFGAHTVLSSLNLPGENYTAVLGRLHRHLRPRNYLEVGVFEGHTIALAGPHTVAIGVDPEPRVKSPPGANTRIHATTSDDYFSRHDVRAELGGLPVDMAFIDGMHHFEFALRDFINIERLCTPDSVILIHDCYPLNRVTAGRERKTVFWSGDIWRLLLLLRKHRPDLEVRTIGASPTGLAMITRLDPDSRLLEERLDALTAEYLALDYAALEGDKDGALNLFPNDWEKILACLPRPFSAPAP